MGRVNMIQFNHPKTTASVKMKLPVKLLAVRVNRKSQKLFPIKKLTTHQKILLNLKVVVMVKIVEKNYQHEQTA